MGTTAIFDQYNIRATILWIPRRDNDGREKISRQEELIRGEGYRGLHPSRSYIPAIVLLV